MRFIPILPERVKFYIDRLIPALSDTGDAVPPAVLDTKARMDEMRAETIENASKTDWLFVKAGIEYIIDFMTTEATPVQYDGEMLSLAYTDLRALIDYVLIVHGEELEPVLAHPHSE